MAKKRKWLYKKDGRFYGDFRPYAEVGGGQEAMKVEGERYATKDYRVAKALAKKRLAELRRLRAHGHAGSEVDLRLLGNFIDHHLVCEAGKGGPSKQLRQTEQQLNVAADFFGEAVLVRSIRTAGIHKYIGHLKQRHPW